VSISKSAFGSSSLGVSFCDFRVKKHLVPKSIFVVLVVGYMTAGCNRPKEQALSSSEPSARHSVDVVKATAKEATIKAGSEGDAIVQLNIQNGYHVNANPPTFSYLIPTELQPAQSPGVSVSFVVYPNPLTKTFPFAEKPLAVYEGVIDIKAKLKVDKTMKPGQHDLPAKVQVQACDNQVCYAPGTLDVTIPLIVK
jgi:hypothetical protein